MIAYHQYGFPQNMEKIMQFVEERNLTLIEDCAHAPQSKYEGRACGSFGQFAVYSFSKFSFCYALGGVAYSDQDFIKFVKERFKNSSSIARFFINLIKLGDDVSLSFKSPSFSNQFSVLRKAAFGVYGDAPHAAIHAVKKWKKQGFEELSYRTSLYKFFYLETFNLGICAHLERDGIAPYAIPIRIDEAKMESLICRLGEIGVRTTINHFDFNRYHPMPDFRKTILIPCHGDVSMEMMVRIIDAIKEVLRGGK
jgi:hypothetical protein